MYYPPLTATAAGPRSSVFAVVRFAMAVLIFVSIALPSGTLFGLPVKYIAYAMAVLSLLFLWGRERVPLQAWMPTLTAFVTAFVLFFILVALFRGVAGPPFIQKEATGFFTTATIVLMLVAARSQGALDDRDIVRFVFYGAFVFALWKSSIVFGLVSGVLSYDNVSAFFMEQAGYRLVSSGIYGGWVRINLIIYDFIVAFMLFVAATYPQLLHKVPRLLRWAFVLIASACVIFAFSRLLFGLVLVLLLFSWAFRFAARTRVIVAIAALAMLSAAAPWLQGAIEQRFNSAGNEASDSLRSQQIDALVNAWTRVPVLGGGFGYSAREMVRDPTAPYNYEVQWVGFLAKLGVVGISCLLALVLALYLNILRGPLTPEHWVLAFALSCFVLGGFTNQYLVTSGSGVFYCLLLAMARFFRQQPATAASVRHES